MRAHARVCLRVGSERINGATVTHFNQSETFIVINYQRLRQSDRIAPGRSEPIVIGLPSPVIGFLEMNLNSPPWSRCVWRVWRSRWPRGPGESAARSGRGERRTAETFRGRVGSGRVRTGQNGSGRQLGAVLDSAPAAQLTLWPQCVRARARAWHCYDWSVTTVDTTSRTSTTFPFFFHHHLRWRQRVVTCARAKPELWRQKLRFKEVRWEGGVSRRWTRGAEPGGCGRCASLQP